MANVLIVDDDKLVCNSLSRTVTRLGHRATYALTLEEGLNHVFSETFDVVLLDVRLPDGNGLNSLDKFRHVPSQPEVIIITGEGDRDGAALAIKSGAWDYIEKPPSAENLKLPLVRALQYRKEKARKPPLALKREGIVGKSPQIMRCFDLVAQAASSDVSVVITGETGTGKELFAHTIHENSLRADNNFVVVDCTVLPKTLVESVLFGYAKGSFTGADRTTEGLIKQADGGTLFLDEVGDLPLSIQKAFLRVLQERCFRPVGNRRETQSNFRLVAATNRDLDDMVKAGRFRQDLLFRLRSFNIDLPPLRERPKDIKPLAIHYMAALCERNGNETKGFSPEFFEVLASYDWPGNVRELNAALEKAFVSARYHPTLFPRHLPTRIRVKVAQDSVKRSVTKGTEDEHIDTAADLPMLQDFRGAAVERAEKRYLQRLFSLTGDVKEACQMSGLSRARLYALLKKHGISRQG